MVKFRRSKMGSDSGIQKPPSVSIPQKDAIAIIPPKKVIKALYDYEPDSGPGYLRFTTGDFLHVVGREHDQDWYEACNPLAGTRGLVPVKYFQVVGKNVRDSGGSHGSGARQSGGGHDSGYGESSSSPPAAMNGMGPPGFRMSKTMGMGKGQGAMVYGVVMYDFKAERPDELDAKEGEAIIVIAQSNPEWFVAKPITRLGGPGLIPVSFIEIRDMATGKAVPDTIEAVQRAGVPKVEEWKKMAADYKNGSIPLGTLSSGSGGGGGGGGDGGGMGAVQQSMDGLSLQGQGQNGNGFAGAGQQQQQQDPPQHQRGYSQQYGSNNNSPEQQTYQSPPGGELLAPIKASVPRYCYADDIFWFIVEVQMSDGRHYELQRLYQDFYDLQISLIQEFPLEAGNVPGHDRSLPYMPGPVTYVTDNISNGRRANLDEYMRKLLKLGPRITQGYLVKRFFSQRDGDYELDPAQVDSYRLSQASQQSNSDPSLSMSQQSSVGNLSNPNVAAYAQQPSGYPQHQRNQSSMSQGPGSSLNPHAGGMPRMNSNISGASSSGAGASAGAGAGAGAGGGTQPCKIKVWFNNEDCVVLRMPPVGQFRYTDLYKKLKERRVVEYGNVGAGEELGVSYRDERDGKMVPLTDDGSLNEALRRNPKLVLDVRAVR